MEVKELFGTLQQSVVVTWRKHLEADKLNVHEILDEFYKDMPEKIDKLIEDWMGLHGKVEDYKNEINVEDYNAVEYLTKLRDFCKDGKSLLDEDELKSDMDDILGMIDSTLYKLKELVKENKMISLSDYINEALNK